MLSAKRLASNKKQSLKAIRGGNLGDGGGTGKCLVDGVADAGNGVVIKDLSGESILGDGKRRGWIDMLWDPFRRFGKMGPQEQKPASSPAAVLPKASDPSTTSSPDDVWFTPTKSDDERVFDTPFKVSPPCFKKTKSVTWGPVHILVYEKPQKEVLGSIWVREDNTKNNSNGGKSRMVRRSARLLNKKMGKT